MAIDTPEKRRKAVAIIANTWKWLGRKGKHFEFHYNEVRALAKEFL